MVTHVGGGDLATTPYQTPLVWCVSSNKLLLMNDFLELELWNYEDTATLQHNTRSCADIADAACGSWNGLSGEWSRQEGIQTSIFQHLQAQNVTLSSPTQCSQPPAGARRLIEFNGFIRTGKFLCNSVLIRCLLGSLTYWLRDKILV